MCIRWCDLIICNRVVFLLLVLSIPISNVKLLAILLLNTWKLMLEIFAVSLCPSCNCTLWAISILFLYLNFRFSFANISNKSLWNLYLSLLACKPRFKMYNLSARASVSISNLSPYEKQNNMFINIYFNSLQPIILSSYL